jgi:hypothetical protein
MSRQIGKLHYLAICVSDMQRSEKFYSSILEHIGYTQAQRMKDPAIPERVPRAQDRSSFGGGRAVQSAFGPPTPTCPTNITTCIRRGCITWRLPPTARTDR